MVRVDRDETSEHLERFRRPFRLQGPQLAVKVDVNSLEVDDCCSISMDALTAACIAALYIRTARLAQMHLLTTQMPACYLK